jgi:aspartate/methionine/tyrosine aminotransferase
MGVHMNLCAKRARNLPVSSTVAIADLAGKLRLQGESVIDLSAGRAAEATPAVICAAAKAALDDGDTHQTPAQGTPSYLAAVSEKLRRENDLDYDPRNGVMATLGCKNGLVLSLLSVLDPGDEVIVEDPCFVSYVPTITLCGGVARRVRLDRDNNYRWRRNDLEAAVNEKTKAILFCSPHNPLGVVHTKSDLSVIADVANAHNLIVIADEIYEAVTWGGRQHTPIASLPAMQDRTIGLMGMTKAYSMGGWRIGYAYAPPAIVDQMTVIQAHFMTCASSINQRAGRAALTESVTEQMRMSVWRDWETRCQFLSGILNEIEHLSCEPPEGGFYAWVDITQTGLDSQTFCERLLKEQKVATVPGVSFGASSEGRVRITCVKARDDITESAERIAAFVRSI